MSRWTPESFLGVIGGVGPGATAVFMDILVRATAAAGDQEHINALVAQHPAIPDRTAHILDPAHHEDPGPFLARDARFLESAGAEFLVLPCNTAHHYAQQVERAIHIPLVSIVDVTVREVCARLAQTQANGGPQHPRKAAILATEGNVKARVYQEVLEAQGIEALVPSAAQQAVVNAVIYEQVKAGKPADVHALRALVDDLAAAGAGAVIFGCTELSLVFDKEQMHTDERIVDSLRELARATVARSGKTLSAQFQ